MNLHDRIMTQMPDDITSESEEFYEGFAESSRKAAQIAKEAGDRIEELETMVKVFRGCIETGVMPSQGSPCHKIVHELVGDRDDA